MKEPVTIQLLIRQAAEGENLRRAVCSKPEQVGVLRMVLTLRRIGGVPVLQAETFYSDHKVRHENFSPDDEAGLLQLIERFGQINLFTTAGDCEYRRSASGKTVVLGGEKLLRALRTGTAPHAEISGNNLEKAHILSGNEPFLILLGVSDVNGRIKDKKQSKFRQINRFLELIRDCLPALSASGKLRICDLCCGKSYLSFAAYHYFANVLGRDVWMTGVDLKPDVIAYCNEVARSLHFDGLEFLCGNVSEYQTDAPVHMVISLHACDLATDLVLEQARAWGAKVILSTPCCHHEMNHTLQCDALSFVAQHSMLRQKLCDAATDALRLKRLEAAGYSVSALELIDPEETPKNVMLRALRRDDFDPNGAEAGRLWEEYRRAKRFLIGDRDDVHF